MQDNFNNTVVSQLLTPLVRTADVNATGHDKWNWRSVLHLAQFGITGDTLSGSVYVDVFLEHSTALSSGYAAVTDVAEITGAMLDITTGKLCRVDANAEDDQLYKVEYKGTKRYSRLRFDFVGSHSNGIEIGALAIASFPRYVGRNQFSDASAAGA